MAIQKAVEKDEVLLHTYSFLSLCANDDVPLETVLKFVKAQIKDQLEVLMKTKIVKSSLSLVHSEEGGERTYLRLHKVVHEALKRGEIPYLKSFESDHTMAEAVKIFKVELDENDENYAFCKKLRPHCESLLKQMTSEFSLDQTTFLERFAPFLDLNTVIDWLHTLTWVCKKTSYFFFAKIVINLAHNLLENLDDTSKGALTLQWKVLNVSGVVYDSLREYNQAKELFEKALMISKQIFDEDHADVASIYNNLALVYYNLKEYNQAKHLQEKALMIRKKSFGEDHSDVEASYNNLALVYNELGEYNQAKELHEKALMISKKICGEDHADVARSYNNLALVYYNLKEYNQAKQLQEKALKNDKLEAKEGVLHVV